jgi:anhydro-N-acetylmuramic acid kinase
MNKNIANLYELAAKPARRIIGLMSGTSLDGLDIALCEVAGSGTDTSVALVEFTTVPYTEDVKRRIREVFAKDVVPFPYLVLLNGWIGELHAHMVLGALEKWGIAASTIDLVASHGQTVMHSPKSLHMLPDFSNATFQIGDGDHVAVRTGITTISDFRQKHVAAGGEGAPLAVFGDYYIFSKKGENRILLNMGGIANFTYLPASANAEEVFVTDTGPGNTLLDAFARRLANKDFDENAAIASRGRVNEALLAALKANDFFSMSFPKTTGPELFNVAYVLAAQEQSHTADLGPEDVLATLTRFSADTIAAAILQTVPRGAGLASFDIYMSGGGMHNPLLVQTLQDQLPCRFMRTDDLGVAGDAKEAVLFAVLANETVAGNGTSFGNRKGIPSVFMGKISFPS